MNIVGVTEEDFLELFLAQSDLPEMQQVQDSRQQGPDAADLEFPKYRGLFAGFAVWMTESDATLWRLVDIRWSFPRVSDAMGYQQDAVQRYSEGAPQLPVSEHVGDQYLVFGFTDRTIVTEAVVGGRKRKVETQLTAFHYVFRVGNVVFKVFGAQGTNCPPERLLTPEIVADYAARAAHRAEGTSQ